MTRFHQHGWVTTACNCTRFMADRRRVMAITAMYGQEVIVPSVDELNIETGGFVCDFEGCGEVFKGSSQLHMHQAKHHRKKPLLMRSGSTLYCCPVSGCDRSKGGKGKPFPRLGQLKQVRIFVCTCVYTPIHHVSFRKTSIHFVECDSNWATKVSLPTFQILSWTIYLRISC